MTEPEPAQQRSLPAIARIVAFLFVVFGGLYAVLGVAGVSSDERSAALVAMGMLVLGAVCVLVGWRLFRGERWAFVAAVVLLGSAAALIVGSAFLRGERTVAGTAFLPALGTVLLLLPSTRGYFFESREETGSGHAP